MSSPISTRSPFAGRRRKIRPFELPEHPGAAASYAELEKRDLAGVVVYDPLNVRYATDSTDMQLWCTHNPVRYAFVATEGPVILWDFHNCQHLSWHLEL